MEVPVNLQTFVSPTDTTVFLNATPTILDPDYIPETKVSISQQNLSTDTSSIIREISTVKTEAEIKN